MYSIAFLMIIMIITNIKAISQEDEDEQEEYSVYHFAYATIERDGINTVYISNVTELIYYNPYDFSTDINIPEELKRQYLEYVSYFCLKKGESEKCEFIGYKMAKDKKEITLEYKRILKEYTQKNFKISKVPKWRYD